MEPTTQVARIFITSKPINFYVYAGLVFLGLYGIGFIAVFLEGDAIRDGTISVVLACVAVIVLSYFARFYLARNYQPLREKVLSAESDEMAWNLLLGGFTWGIGSIVLLAITFYISIQVFL